jgi:DNA-binding NarL/FixJ family response regulator
MHKKIRVLVTDDHLLMRQGVCRILEKEDDMECVAVAEDGEQAIKLAKELTPDIVILDVAMPKMNGIQVIEAMKTTCPEVAILVLSAYDYGHYVRACTHAGADGYLLKNNIRGKKLQNAIHMILDGESVFDREVTNRVYTIPSFTKDTEIVGSTALSNRELEVLKLTAEGKSNKQIALELSITEQTAATHLANIMRKLGVSTRIKAALLAVREGLIITDSNCKDRVIEG